MMIRMTTEMTSSLFHSWQSLSQDAGLGSLNRARVAPSGITRLPVNFARVPLFCLPRSKNLGKSYCGKRDRQITMRVQTKL